MKFSLTRASSIPVTSAACKFGPNPLLLGMDERPSSRLIGSNLNSVLIESTSLPCRSLKIILNRACVKSYSNVYYLHGKSFKFSTIRRCKIQDSKIQKFKDSKV